MKTSETPGRPGPWHRTAVVRLIPGAPTSRHVYHLTGFGTVVQLPWTT